MKLKIYVYFKFERKLIAHYINVEITDSRLSAKLLNEVDIIRIAKN